MIGEEKKGSMNSLVYSQPRWTQRFLRKNRKRNTKNLWGGGLLSYKDSKGVVVTFSQKRRKARTSWKGDQLASSFLLKEGYVKETRCQNQVGSYPYFSQSLGKSELLKGGRQLFILSKRKKKEQSASIKTGV